MKPEFKYSCTVTRVVDGDTIDCLVDLGFHTFIKERFRLFGIDTPEKNSKIPEVRDIAIRATEFTKAKLEGKTVLIETVNKDKYGRWLGIIYIDGVDQTINEQLVINGLAKAYYGDNKELLGWEK
jgi:micrococcal nuclease